MNDCIYITYCSKKKLDYSVCGSRLVFPSELYTSSRIQEFISFCKRYKYTWAIFSDYYGIVSENDKIGWYDKSPNMITDNEYYNLLKQTVRKLENFDTIFLYFKSKTFHPIYKRLANDLKKYKQVVFIERLEDCDEKENE